jgi:hypothetical protein
MLLTPLLFNPQVEFTIPNMSSDDEALDCDVALLSEQRPCVAVDSSFSIEVDGSETVTTTTAIPESDTFKYCAQVTTTLGKPEQSFDFFGCSTMLW